MLGTAGIRGDEGQIDIVLQRAGKGDLGLLRLFLDALQSIRLLAQVHSLVALELVQHPIHEAIVPVVAAEVSIAVGGFDVEHAVAEFQHRDVERAAAEVVHCDLLVLLLF